MASILPPLSGRRGERAILERLLGSRRSEFLAVYGRRRVGKTFLVRRFFQERSVTYFEMVGRFEGSQADQLQIFADSLSSTFYRDAPLAAFPDWHAAFRALVRAIEERKGRRRRTVLFFDELPWIDTHRSGFLRELEHFWNSWCSRRNDIILIACGSAASWMLRRIVNAKGGLHDRLTQTIRLLPFSLAETQEFFEARKVRLGLRDLIELYMILGGVPHYLDHVRRGRSVAQIVDDLCFEKDGALRDEFDRLFASLFGSDKKHVAVVRALAKRRGGLDRNQLLAAAGLPTGGGATTVFENLEQGGFIRSSVPFGKTERDRIFRLTDPFSLFHLRWMEGRKATSWRHVHRTPAWQAWAGLGFEGLCLEHAPAIQRALGISGVRAEVSAWRSHDAQIDLLIDRADGVITVCEMKFTAAPFRIDKRYATELREKLARFRDHTKTKKALQLVFVTSYGLEQNPYSDELVDQVLMMDVLVG